VRAAAALHGMCAVPLLLLLLLLCAFSAAALPLAGVYRHPSCSVAGSKGRDTTERLQKHRDAAAAGTVVLAARTVVTAAIGVGGGDGGPVPEAGGCVWGARVDQISNGTLGGSGCEQGAVAS